MINNTVQMIPEMVTLRTASQRTGVSYDWLRKKCLQGSLVYIKAGTKYLINFGKLVDYLNKGDRDGGVKNEEYTNY